MIFLTLGKPTASGHPIFPNIGKYKIMNNKNSFKLLLIICVCGLFCSCVSLDAEQSRASGTKSGLHTDDMTPDTQVGHDAYVLSIERLSEGKQGEAESLIDEGLVVFQGDEKLWFAKGVLRRSRWAKDEAMCNFAQLVHEFPLTVEARAAELSLLLDQGVDAENNLKKLITLSRKNTADFYLLWLTAIQCREQKNGPQGHLHYTKLLKRCDVGPVMVNHTIANILTEQLKHYDEAMTHRRIAVSQESRGWSLQGMANTLTSMGCYEESCAVWEKCLATSPDNDLYWYQWGGVLYMMKQYEQALEKYTTAIQLNPENGRYFHQVALCHKKLGNHTEMADSLYRELALGMSGDAELLASSPLNGVNGSAHFGLARVYILSKDPAFRDPVKGLRYAKSACEKIENFGPLDVLSQAYAANGMYTEAVEVTERVMERWESRGKKAPDNVMLHYREYTEKAEEQN